MKKIARTRDGVTRGFACSPVQAAQNAARRAGSLDPVVIAERLGLAVYGAERALTMGADAAVLRDRIYVLETVDASEVRPLVAEMLGVALVGLWSLDVGAAGNNRGAAEAAYGRAFAAALRSLASGGTA
jgi:hypothetical protein